MQCNGLPPTPSPAYMITHQHSQLRQLRNQQSREANCADISPEEASNDEGNDCNEYLELGDRHDIPVPEYPAVWPSNYEIVQL